MRHRILATLDGLDHDVALLAAAIQNATREWREELGEASEDAIVWQPAPNGHSIGALMLHIAEVEIYWIQEVAAGIPMSAEDEKRLMSHEIQQYEGRWPTPPSLPLTHYWSLLDEVRARSLALLPSLGSADRSIKLESSTVTVGWILAHVASHEAYHGGQAVLVKSLSQTR